MGLRRWLLLAVAGSMAAPAVAGICDFRIPSQQDGRGGTVAPLSAHADAVLRADLTAAAALEDPLQAIHRLQQNFFAMQHPELPGATGYIQARCGSRATYQILHRAIRARVAELVEDYRSNRQFIGDAGVSMLPDPAQSRVRPGVFELLLMADRYEAFETQALNFLRSETVINDPAAAEYFDQISSLAGDRVQALGAWADTYARESNDSPVTLLKDERDGLSALAGFSERADALRANHVAYWLERESSSFDQVLANPPAKGQLMQLSFDAQTALAQLKNALRIALPADREPLRELAERRGDRLMADDRPGLAVDYFDLAGLQAQAAAAERASEARTARIGAELKKAAEGFVETMQKSEAERAEFDSETDALAEELGIDL